MHTSRCLFPTLLLIFSLGLGGCRASTSVPGDPVPQEPAATSNVVEKSSPTVVSTLVQVPTATNTAIPTSISTAAPTPESDEQAWIAAIRAAGAPVSLQAFSAPDQEWTAEVARYECTDVPAAGGELAYEELLFVRPDGVKAAAADQLLYCGGLGAYGLNGLAWSPNSRYFYFNRAREGTPDGMACGLWNKGLSRVDRTTLETETLPGEGPLSPDGRQMLLWAQTDFVLWDLDEGAIGQLANPFEAYRALSIEFSGDGQRAAVVMRADCIGPDAPSAVVILDLAEMTSKTVLEAAEPAYVRAAWSSNDTLTLEDFNGLFYELRLSTGEIIPLESPAPTP